MTVNLNRADKLKQVPIEELYSLRPGTVWKVFSSDNFSFWMVCAYLFFEYVRPQAIWSVFEVYPYWARTFILLAFIGWVADPKRQFVWTKITTGISAYLILVILSSNLAYWPDISWSYFMDFFNWVVVFFVLTQVTTTRQRFFILLLIFMVASFKLSQHGARTWAMRGFGFTKWGLMGPRGYFQNSGELAIQMVVFAPIAYFFILGIKSYLKRWQVNLLYLMPITASMTVLGASSRGGQLALAVQLVALIMMTKNRFKALIVIVVIGFIGFQSLPEEQKARLNYIGSDTTSMQRILYLQHGWSMIKNHPYLGVGYFNFSSYYDLYYSDDLLTRKEAEVPHNIFIQIGTDVGFSGLGIYLSLLGMSWAAMRKIGKKAARLGDVFVCNLAKGMNLALLGYVVAAQFVTVTYYPFFWIHLMFVTSMCTFFCNEQNKLAQKNRIEKRSSLDLGG